MAEKSDSPSEVQSASAPSNEKLLLRAAAKGDIESINKLLKEKIDINAKSPGGHTSINIAAHAGHAEICRLLLINRANVENMTAAGFAAIHSAVSEGHEETVKVLLEHKAIVDCKDLTGGTALLMSAEDGRDNLCRLLLAHGADIEAPNFDGVNALHKAAGGNETISTCKLLLENKAQLETRDKQGRTALHWAAIRGRAKIVSFLLDEKADIEAKTKVGDTALSIACDYKHTAIVQILVERRANLDPQLNSLAFQAGTTPLMLCAFQGFNDGIRILLEHKASLNITTSAGWGALHFAARGDRDSVYPLLVEAKMDLEQKTEDGMTALHVTAEHGSADAAQSLLKVKADINARDHDGNTPLHFSVMFGKLNVCKLLVRHTADINAVNKEGESALHWAARRGHLDCCKVLVEGKANIELQSWGVTPLMVAEKEEIQELLQKASLALLTSKPAEVSSSSSSSAGEAYRNAIAVEKFNKNSSSYSSNAGDYYGAMASERLKKNSAAYQDPSEEYVDRKSIPRIPTEEKEKISPDITSKPLSCGHAGHKLESKNYSDFYCNYCACTVSDNVLECQDCWKNAIVFRICEFCQKNNRAVRLAHGALVSVSQFRLQRAQLELGSVMGVSGHFSTNYRATAYVRDSYHVDSEVKLRRLVVKKVRRNLFVSEEDEQLEISTLIHLCTHPNIVRFVGYSVTTFRWIATEQAEYGSLDTITALPRKQVKKEGEEEEKEEKNSQRERLLSDKDCITSICHDLFSGLAHMHSLGYIHRDLAARNALMDGNGSVLLTDFGLTRYIGRENNASYVRGENELVPRLAAPESDSGVISTFASDVWMMGMTILEILQGRQVDNNEGMVVFNQVKGICSDKIAKVLESCLATDPTKRPTAAKACENIGWAVGLPTPCASKMQVSS